MCEGCLKIRVWETGVPAFDRIEECSLSQTGRPSRFAFIFCGPTRVHLVQFLGVYTRQSHIFGISKIKGKSREIRANLGASEFGFITFGAPSLAHHICFELCRAYPRPAGMHVTPTLIVTTRHIGSSVSIVCRSTDISHCA